MILGKNKTNKIQQRNKQKMPHNKTTKNKTNSKSKQINKGEKRKKTTHKNYFSSKKVKEM